MRAALEKISKLRGKLALQDLPFVIDDISDLDGKIERVKHDFMTPQPIHGGFTSWERSLNHMLI